MTRQLSFDRPATKRGLFVSIDGSSGRVYPPILDVLGESGETASETRRIRR
ncbi:MAG: hypothetical protein ACRDRX_23605 [Pseudonocardiaceae bacterium]